MHRLQDTQVEIKNQLAAYRNKNNTRIQTASDASPSSSIVDQIKESPLASPLESFMSFYTYQGPENTSDKVGVYKKYACKNIEARHKNWEGVFPKEVMDCFYKTSNSLDEGFYPFNNYYDYVVTFDDIIENFNAHWINTPDHFFKVVSRYLGGDRPSTADMKNLLHAVKIPSPDLKK